MVSSALVWDTLITTSVHIKSTKRYVVRHGTCVYRRTTHTIYYTITDLMPSRLIQLPLYSLCLGYACFFYFRNELADSLAAALRSFHLMLLLLLRQLQLFIFCSFAPRVLQSHGFPSFCFMYWAAGVVFAVVLFHCDWGILSGCWHSGLTNKSQHITT